jgi:glycosyltransferase involved in cell wall biosynthesis
MLDVSIVVPVRNAAALVPDCLRAAAQQDALEIIVIDGNSTDNTVALAEPFASVVLSDEGRGLPVARRLGAERAKGSLVMLLDADVVLAPGALAALVEEFHAGDYAALQAGLESVGGPGYWGAALAHHHRTGRSRHWFGLVATLIRRDELLQHGFDDRFISGEDIELRWRLRDLGRPTGVSTRTVVQHRFAGDDFAFAKDQFLMDGRGLARMVLKHRSRGLRLVALPALAAGRGVLLSLFRAPRYVPYFCAFAVFNYVGFGQVLGRRRVASTA